MWCKILSESLRTRTTLPKPVIVQVVKLGSLWIRVGVTGAQLCKAALQLSTDNVEKKHSLLKVFHCCCAVQKNMFS